ncbi:MAG: TonB-dependent receptor, partial [Sphingomonas sp.]|nr:TonB-dependent receptor [Sphingomonas sp.]
MAAPAVAASAPSVSLQIPAGRLGDAVAALAGQAGVSVSVPDAALWARPVPALNGRMTVRDAVRRLATAAGGRAVALPGDGWRIIA